MRVLILVALLGAAVDKINAVNLFLHDVKSTALPKRQLQRIVGGEPTTIENYPYMSNMEYNLGNSWTQYCAGSLLTSTTVLSAGHCFFSSTTLAFWRVRLGSSYASSGGSIHYVNRMKVHEEYNYYTLDNDIALIWLYIPAVWSAHVAAARIPGANYILAAGTKVRSIGWGALTSGGSAPEQLHHVEIDAIDQAVCAERYAYLNTQPGYQDWPEITDAKVCAGILDVGGKDACQGDDGGPLAHQGDVIYGVMSWGYGCADATYPGVYSRVGYYTDWILASL